MKHSKTEQMMAFIVTYVAANVYTFQPIPQDGSSSSLFTSDVLVSDAFTIQNP